MLFNWIVDEHIIKLSGLSFMVGVSIICMIDAIKKLMCGAYLFFISKLSKLVSKRTKFDR